MPGLKKSFINPSVAAYLDGWWASWVC